MMPLSSHLNPSGGISFPDGTYTSLNPSRGSTLMNQGSTLLSSRLTAGGGQAVMQGTQQIGSLLKSSISDHYSLMKGVQQIGSIISRQGMNQILNSAGAVVGTIQGPATAADLAVKAFSLRGGV